MFKIAELPLLFEQLQNVFKGSEKREMGLEQSRTTT